MLDPVSRQLAEMQLRKLVFNLIPSQQGHSRTVILYNCFPTVATLHQ